MAWPLVVVMLVALALLVRRAARAERPRRSQTDAMARERLADQADARGIAEDREIADNLDI